MMNGRVPRMRACPASRPGRHGARMPATSGPERYTVSPTAGERPASGAVRDGPRHGPATGRAARPPLGGRRPRRRQPPRPPYPRQRRGHPDAARAQDEPEPPDRVPARCGGVGPPGSSDPAADGADGGGVPLGRDRARVREHHRHAAPCGDRQPGLQGGADRGPGCPTAGSTTCAMPPRRSCCRGAWASRTSRTSSGTPRSR